MINAAGALLAGCLALLAAAAAGQSTTNSTEGKLAYVSGQGWVGWLLPPLPPPVAAGPPAADQLSYKLLCPLICRTGWVRATLKSSSRPAAATAAPPWPCASSSRCEAVCFGGVVVAVGRQHQGCAATLAMCIQLTVDGGALRHCRIERITPHRCRRLATMPAQLLAAPASFLHCSTIAPRMPT